MFNFLGSIFGYGSNQKLDENEVNVVETAITNNQSTQTNCDNNEIVLDTVGAKTPADWVIVDRSEEAERFNSDAKGKADVATSTIEMGNSAMLGSFFEKNQIEDEEFNRKYKSNQMRVDDEENMMQTTSKDWLITPLPCLTSITASQRSIVDNDPLENLLIEHPSMSVFVAATSGSDTSFDEEEMNVDENKETKKGLKEIEKNHILVKSVSEKRKVPSPVKSESSPTGSLKRKGKKNKKTTSPAPQLPSPIVTPAVPSNTTKTSNKENMSVLLANDYKKSASRLESLLLNKNQMKRSNKNCVFSNTGAKNANIKHRKYHKLQQPSCFQSRPVF